MKRARNGQAEILLKQTTAMLHTGHLDRLKELIMRPAKSTSVVILPGAIAKPALEDVIQALHHVEFILSINDDDTIEPGHLSGMSLMLQNAEKVLAEMRAALPSARREPRPPTADSTLWPNIGQIYTPSH
jgi:hypothetical protein